MRLRDTLSLVLPMIVLLLFVLLPVTVEAAGEAELERLLGEQQERLQTLTGYQFHEPVSLRFQDTESFGEYLEEQWEQMGPEFVERMGTKLILLGLLERDEDLVAAMNRLYQEQAGAHYDPRNRSINILSPDLPPMAMNFLLFHELVHAYQDERYDLHAMRVRAWESNDFDHQMSMVFLLEGHANFLSYLDMLGQREVSAHMLRNPMVEHTFGSVARMSEMSPEAMRAAEALLEEPVADDDVIEQTPEILHRILTDPYFVGPQAWLFRAQQVGWPEAETWLGDDQPLTTREILIGRPGQVPRVEGRSGTPLGFYLFLRWVDGFPSVPEWTREKTGDYAWLNEDETRLTWLIEFSGKQEASRAEEEILQMLGLDPGEAVSGQPATVEYNGRQRSFTLERGTDRLCLQFSLPSEQSELR